ncbi:MAG TPA: MAPEG family protein [Polyangia bacterium]|jgi:hypothetical protein|nr:MAPEG family protein [Polyangia bacterium]
MEPEAIFVPVAVLAIWTQLVAFMTGMTRVRAARAGRVPRGAFKFGESPEVPNDVAVVNRNLMNLLEMPVLFYAVAVAFYVTHHAEPSVVRLSWIYVGLRLAHSIVHLTSNRIIPRLMMFAASNVVLLTMWVGFLRRVL